MVLPCLAVEMGGCRVKRSMSIFRRENGDVMLLLRTNGYGSGILQEDSRLIGCGGEHIMLILAMGQKIHFAGFDLVPHQRPAVWTGSSNMSRQ